MRVSCGCDWLRTAYQVPSSARNAKTLTWSFSSCVIVPSPQISAPSTCHTAVLAVLSEDSRVQRAQDVDRHGVWQSHAQGLGKNGDCDAWQSSVRIAARRVTRTGNLWTRSSKLPTLDNSRLGSMSVVGPHVQLKEVFQKTPPVATACPVVVSKQRHRLRAWAAESSRTTISRVAQAVLVVLVGVQVEREPL